VRVDVVVPCYNYGHLLPACLESVLSQEGVETRVLIVDDASPDGSGRVAKRLAADDPRVEVLEHGVNQGHIRTYNDGLERVAGDYVVLLSADDLLTPGALKRATDLMERHPQVGFTYGYSQYFDGDTIPPLRLTSPKERVYSGADWIARRCRTATNIISSPEVVVRASLQREVGGYREDLPHSGDLEMWLRLAARADVGVITGVDQALYRVHPQSMSRTDFAPAIADLRQRHRAFEVFFDTAGAGHPDVAGWRAAVQQATARKVIWRASRQARLADPEDRRAAAELAGFAVSVWPEVLATPEGRAWSWTAGSSPAWSPLPVAATALRGRLADRRYWRDRKRLCV
jgi:GT2 family glycosyltransferase